MVSQVWRHCNKCHVGVWESKVHEPVNDHGVWRTQELREWYKMLCFVTDIERMKSRQLGQWSECMKQRWLRDLLMATQKEAGKWEALMVMDQNNLWRWQRSDRGKRHEQRWLGIYRKEDWGSLRNMETKSKNVLSDKDLCTEYDGRVEKMVK